MDTNLTKKIEETEEQYLWRVGKYIEAHPEISWGSVGDVINRQLGHTEDEWKSASTFREKYRVAKHFYDNAFIKMNKDDAEKYLQEIKKERIKLQTLNVERNKLDRQEARQELYYEQIGSYLRNSDDELSPCLENLEPFKDEDFEKEYILVISDIHAYASFISLNNRYDPEIMADRFEFMGEKTIQFIQEHNLKRLHIVNCGDSIQGIIHMNDLKINDSSVVKATVAISRLLTKFISEISKHCHVDYYHVPTSNHTQIRFLGTKANALMDEDLEYIIGHYIKDSLASNAKVHVHLQEEDQGFISFECCGFDIVAMHGHLVKNLESVIRDMSALLGENIDYLIMGHQHSTKELTVGETILADTEVLVAPSFVGSDPYADSIFRGSKAAFKIYGIDHLDGHNETYKFILN